MNKTKELQDINFENLQIQLEQIKSKGGDNIVQHLQKVFRTLILHSPDKALANFEEVSTLIKENKELGDFLKLEDIRTYKEVANDQSEYTAKVKPAFEGPVPNEDGEVAEVAPVGYVQDLMKEARIYQWAGISFGE